jgi:peptidoglycan hydrolase CwlO-like protein
MNEMLLMSIFGVLALYFFGSMNVYKSMYRKIKEEKEIAESMTDNRDKDIKKYEVQLRDALDTINNLDEKLAKAREEIQKEKIQKNELKHRNELLQKRVDELYSSVGMI